MKNKTVLSGVNSSRMELVLEKLPRPMTAGQIVRYLEENSSLVPEFIREEGVCRSTFISRIVNTAKYGKNNKIAITRRKNGEAKFHLGCGYLLYHDDNKINYTKKDLEAMRHHAQGRPRPKARKNSTGIGFGASKQYNSAFVTFMTDDVRKFEAMMETGFLGEWTNLSAPDKKKIYLNFSSNVEAGLKKMIFGDVEIEGVNLQVIDRLPSYQVNP